MDILNKISGMLDYFSSLDYRRIYKTICKFMLRIGIFIMLLALINLIIYLTIGFLFDIKIIFFMRLATLGIVGLILSIFAGISFFILDMTDF